MASVIADCGFVVALLNRRDRHHRWAAAVAGEMPHPWHTCEAAMSEAFFLMRGGRGLAGLAALLERRILCPSFQLDAELAEVLGLLQKYANVPMSLADGCLVRMTETMPDPVLLTTDQDFRVYRRHGRRVIPARLP